MSHTSITYSNIPNSNPFHNCNNTPTTTGDINGVSIADANNILVKDYASLGSQTSIYNRETTPIYNNDLKLQNTSYVEIFDNIVDLTHRGDKVKAIRSFSLFDDAKQLDCIKYALNQINGEALAVMLDAVQNKTFLKDNILSFINYAVIKDNYKSLDVLLEKSNIAKHEVTSIFTKAILKNPNIEIAKVFLKAGVDPDGDVSLLSTTLLIELLKQYDANDKNVTTRLAVLLVNYGASKTDSFNASESSITKFAIDHDMIALLDALTDTVIKNNNNNVFNSGDNDLVQLNNYQGIPTYLQQAIDKLNPQAVKILIEKGSNLAKLSTRTLVDFVGLLYNTHIHNNPMRNSEILQNVDKITALLVKHNFNQNLISIQSTDLAEIFSSSIKANMTETLAIIADIQPEFINRNDEPVAMEYAIQHRASENIILKLLDLKSNIYKLKKEYVEALIENYSSNIRIQHVALSICSGS